jgi:branched-chain amino acid aminotransferase
MRVWHEGKLLKGRVAISAFDRGLTLGDGIFETLAVVNGVALWRFEHLQRMQKAAQELGIPFPEDDIENCVDGLTHRAGGHSVLRLTLTRGESARGLAGDGKMPTLVGTLQSFDASLRFQPARLVTSTVRRNEHAPSSRIKTLSYVDNIMAAREADEMKADDALMLNTAGRIASATIGNVFMVNGDVLVTPALSEGILPGVMRQAVIAAAHLAGIKVKEKRLQPADAMTADGLFVTNSLRFVRPVTKLDSKRFRTTSKPMKTIIQALLQAEQEQLLLV